MKRIMKNKSSGGFFLIHKYQSVLIANPALRGRKWAVSPRTVARPYLEHIKQWPVSYSLDIHNINNQLNVGVNVVC